MNKYLKQFIGNVLPASIGWIVFQIINYFNHPIIGLYSFLSISVFGWVIVQFYFFKTKDLTVEVLIFNLFLIIILTLIFFAGLYSLHLPGDSYMIENGNKSNLTFSNALYFSTATMATVGYGDIVPHGVFRQFAMVQIWFSFILVGIFLASFGELYKQKGSKSSKNLYK